MRGIPTRSTVVFLVVSAALAVPPPGGLAAQEQEQECELSASSFTQEAAGLIRDGREAEEEDDAEEAREKYQEAMDLLTLSLQQDTADATAHFFAGIARAGLGDYRAADSLFTRFVALKPECAAQAQTERRRAWALTYRRGVRQYQGGQQDSALALWEKANAIYSEPQTLVNTAILHEQRGNLDRAVELYREAAASADSTQLEAQALSNLARILQAQGKNEEALRTFEEYLAGNPKATGIKVSYAAALVSAGQRDSARAIYESLLEREELDFRVLANVGVGLSQLGEPEPAGRAFARARGQRPYDKTAMENLFSSLLQSEQYERAAALGDTLIRWFPYDKQNFRLLARALDRLGRTDRVQEVLQGLQGAPLEFVSLQMTEREGYRYVVQGSVSGQEAAGKTVGLTIELLGRDGSVVSQKEVEIQLPPSGQTRGFQTVVQSEEPAVGFRYRPVGGG